MVIFSRALLRGSETVALAFQVFSGPVGLFLRQDCTTAKPLAWGGRAEAAAWQPSCSWFATRATSYQRPIICAIWMRPVGCTVIAPAETGASVRTAKAAAMARRVIMVRCN